MSEMISSGIGQPDTVVTTALTVDVQYALKEDETEEPPGRAALETWAQSAYANVESNVAPHGVAHELTVRVVDAAEMLALNTRYRGQPKLTNVLSFTAELDPVIGAVPELQLLGDIVVCHSVILGEAGQQQKTVSEHYAHMVVHGVLHLCGYDHQDDESAETMEALERQILAKNGIDDPYRA